MTTATHVMFGSTHAALRVVRKPAVEQYINGNKVVVEPEVTYEFENGKLFVSPGDDTFADKVVFGEGVVEQDAIGFLREHPQNGVLFTEIVPVAPDPGPLFAEIADALLAGDADKLHAIGDAEYEEWNRPEVMERVRKGLDLLEAKSDKE